MIFMISGLEGSQGIFLFVTTFSKLIRKPYSEPVVLMISELEGSEATFLFLTASQKLLENHT